MKSLLIELLDLYFYAENLPILKNVSLKIYSGDFLGVVGPNGGGKTTLFRLIAGFLSPSSGTLYPVPSLRIGYVPQTSWIDRDFPITTFHFLLTGAVSRSLWWGRYPSSVKEEAVQILQRLRLESHQDKLLGSLSGGLLQKALLGRALMAHPNLLLLDEPTSNVDIHAKQEIMELLETFRGEKTVLMVTHDWKLLTEHFSQILYVNQKAALIPKEKLCHHMAMGLYHPWEENPW